MCMLCVVPPHVLPDKEKLINSALNNPHGFGFAIVVPEDKYIISERSMNADESINRFLDLRAKFPNGHAMWHARFATHGSNTVENCHPFTVGEDPSTYLGHNGVLPVIEYSNLDWSDTRIFANDILPNMGGVAALDHPQLLNMIEDFTYGSKICVLTVDPKAQKECYIIHEEKGKRDESGVWWSNDSCYLATPKPAYTWYGSGYYDSKFEDSAECSGCLALLDEEELEKADWACIYCGTCFDCQDYIEFCQCPDRDNRMTWVNQYWTSKPAPKKIHSVPLSEELPF